MAAAEFPIPPAAFLACFPAPPPARAPRSLPEAMAARSADPPDIAALRAARPLDEASVRRALRDLPLLAAFVAISTRLGRLLRHAWARVLLLNVPEIFLFLLVFPFGNGAFATRALAAGTVAIVLQAAWWTWTVHSERSNWFSGGVGPKAERDDPEKAPELPSPSEERDEAGALAGVVRYLQLVGDCSAQGGFACSAFLEHDSTNEDLCPCTKCTKVAVRVGTVLTAVAGISLFVFGICVWIVLRTWTPVVSLGQYVWRTPWSATLAAVALAAMVIYAPASCFVPLNILNGGWLDLELRLRLRAVTTSLAELHDKLARAASEPDFRPPEISASPYVALHGRLLSEWADNVLFSAFFGRAFRNFVLSDLLAALLNAAVATCIPASYVASIALVLYMASWYMFATAAVNRQCDAVAVAYRRAALDLDLLADSFPDAPGVARRSIAAHKAVLERFSQLDGARARFLGLPVTVEVIRALATTVATLAVALWSVLRSVGVSITIENLCPVGS
ncbi:hypothetical protein DFJ74DRAFT_764946 [Hyaloraphidium curvatum]|nr:hypothetical protein DFJ74DRAFT_764946 [Hyaloraphidium curvatum]